MIDLSDIYAYLQLCATLAKLCFNSALKNSLAKVLAYNFISSGFNVSGELLNA